MDMPGESASGGADFKCATFVSVPRRRLADPPWRAVAVRTRRAGISCWRLAVFLLVVTFLVRVPIASCAERVVLLEKFSAMWCGHCMTASQAIDGLMTDHSNQFIPLEVFSSTSGRYALPWGVSRALAQKRV